MDALTAQTISNLANANALISQHLMDAQRENDQLRELAATLQATQAALATNGAVMDSSAAQTNGAAPKSKGADHANV